MVRISYSRNCRYLFIKGSGTLADVNRAGFDELASRISVLSLLPGKLAAMIF